jgi:hypothetical protein
LEGLALICQCVVQDSSALFAAPHESGIGKRSGFLTSACADLGTYHSRIAMADFQFGSVTRLIGTEAAPGAFTYLVEQRFGIGKIGCVETLGEAAVDRREQIKSVGPLALFAPMPGKAGGSAQFPQSRTLLSRHSQGAMKASLGLLLRVPTMDAEPLPLNPTQFRFEPSFAHSVCRLQRRID